MHTHLQRNLEDVKKMLLTMGAMVEECIERATRVLRTNLKEEAQAVEKDDDAIDRLELKIEDECLKVLALYQPVAEDLRFVAAVMKINSDLERLGDLAANMAKRGGLLEHAVPEEMTREFEGMSQGVIRMLRGVLQAFVERDALSARQVVQQDDAIDSCHKKMIHHLTAFMKENPRHVEPGVQLLWVSRNLERIADHITNIAEDVVYMVEGETIRHQPWSLPGQPAPAGNGTAEGTEFYSETLSFRREPQKH